MGHQSASTVVCALSARSAVGCNLRARSSALLLQGVRWVHQSASTVVERHEVQGVRWVTICEHGRQRSHCKECGGASICEHGRRRSKCKECGGGAICEHGRRALSARSAVGHQSASTVVGVIDARSVAPQRLERMHSSARTPNVVQHIFLQLPIYRTDPRAVVSPPPPDPSSAAAWP